MSSTAPRVVDTIRFLAVDAVEQAKSGHPGMPLGAAPMAFALWDRVLKHNPSDPAWFDRDRFILSAGHGSMLLYALLYLTGYEGLTLEELKSFRQWGSKTPGHPEYGVGVVTADSEPIYDPRVLRALNLTEEQLGLTCDEEREEGVEEAVDQREKSHPGAARHQAEAGDRYEAGDHRGRGGTINRPRADQQEGSEGDDEQDDLE